MSINWYVGVACRCALHSGKRICGVNISAYQAIDEYQSPSQALDGDAANKPYAMHYLFEWLVVAFGAGVAIYFALPYEPSEILYVPFIVCSTLVIIISQYKYAGTQTALRLISLMILFISLGVGRSVIHTRAISAPALDEYRSSYEITGWIETVQASGSGFRWQIAVTDMSKRGEAIDVDMRLKRVRIRTKTNGLSPGDGVQLRAIINGPPGPVIAGGYDPARRAFFNQIGGYGFAISTPQSADVATHGLVNSKRSLVRFRERLTQRILIAAPQQTAGLQAALLTGERAYIEREQTDVLRAAGLAHVLAISGLHMGLIAGGAFWLAAMLLACLDPLARRYDVRKAAAVVGICTATFYLALSGGSVSTQRAYIMAVVLFSAVLLARPAVSMRSVAVAAAITLWLHPESLTSAGFQMSFGATAGLVAVYKAWRERFTPRYRPGFLRRALSNFTGLAATSLIAGAATGGFAAIHFHRVARLGFFANLAAMPLFTFIVMPMGFAALLLMPMGLEAYPLAVMGWGLDGMLTVSRYIAGLPGAQHRFTAAPLYASAVFGIGFIGLCLGPARIRIAGASLIAGLALLWSVTHSADMRVAENAHVAFWEITDTGSTLYVERTRADGYGVAQFIERAGEADADRVSFKDERADCDAQACRMDLKGKTISIVNSPEIAARECQNADIVVLTQRRSGPKTRRHCQALLLDERYLSVHGAQDVYLSGKTIRLKPAKPTARGRRPWG